MEPVVNKQALLEKMMNGSEYRLPVMEDLSIGAKFLMLDWNTAWGAVMDGKSVSASGTEIELTSGLTRVGDVIFVDYCAAEPRCSGIFWAEADAFIGEEISDQTFPTFFLVKK